MNHKTNIPDHKTNVPDHKANILDHIIIAVFFLTATVLVPLCLHNGYFDFIETKGMAYVSGSVIVLALILFNCLYKKSFVSLLPGRDVTDILIGLMAVVILVSTLVSSDPNSSFWGLDGWRAGGYLFLSLILIYFYLSKQSLVIGQNLWLTAMAANLFIFIITILHAADVDVFSVHTRINEKLIYMYMSTLGQANWVSGYLCIVIPLFLFLSLDAANMTSKVIYAAVLIPGIYNVVLCNSDSVLAGLGMAVMFGLPYVMQKVERLQRCLAAVIIFELEVLSVKYLPCFGNKREHLGGLFNKLVSGQWIWALLAATVCLLIGTFFLKAFIEQKHLVITLLIEALLGIIVLYLLADSIRNFSESWGTNRGRTWIYSVKMFQSFSLKEKLIGIGPDMLQEGYTKLSAKFGQSIVAAHNEFLQFLLTTGILGAALWVLGFLSLIAGYFRKKIYNKEAIAFFIPLTAYLGQSFFNSPMVLNVPLAWLVYLCYKSNQDKGSQTLA